MGAGVGDTSMAFETNVNDTVDGMIRRETNEVPIDDAEEGLRS